MLPQFVGVYQYTEILGMGMVNCVPVHEEKQMRKGVFFKLGKARSAIIIYHLYEKVHAFTSLLKTL